MQVVEQPVALGCRCGAEVFLLVARPSTSSLSNNRPVTVGRGLFLDLAQWLLGVGSWPAQCCEGQAWTVINSVEKGFSFWGNAGGEGGCWVVVLLTLSLEPELKTSAGSHWRDPSVGSWTQEVGGGEDHSWTRVEGGPQVEEKQQADVVVHHLK